MPAESAIPESIDFQLLESILIDSGRLCLRDRHVERLLATASFFRFACDVASVDAALDAAEQDHRAGRHKLRLLLHRDGQISTTCERLGTGSMAKIRVQIASLPVSAEDPFLRHKTTHREAYEAALARHPAADDVILWNEAGWITESSRANVVARMGGELLTPPASCGLLPGTFRAELLATGKVREELIDRDGLRRAEAVYLVNSVRGWIDTVFR